jgi:Asp-tRNA(Asn)/Glu-tRNA(Gln) amidotransferase A subunit family amidase
MPGILDESWKKRAAERDKDLGAFLQLDPSIGAADSAPSGPLSGTTFGVKDNIAVRGYQLTCGSRFLEGLICPYTATAVERLQRAGAVVAGKTNLDEFGMGSSTTAGGPAARAAARRPRSPPASWTLRSAATRAARYGSPPPSAASSA